MLARRRAPPADRPGPERGQLRGGPHHAHAPRPGVQQGRQIRFRRNFQIVGGLRARLGGAQAGPLQMHAQNRRVAGQRRRPADALNGFQQIGQGGGQGGGQDGRGAVPGVGIGHGDHVLRLAGHGGKAPAAVDVNIHKAGAQIQPRPLDHAVVGGKRHMLRHIQDTAVFHDRLTLPDTFRQQGLGPHDHRFHRFSPPFHSMPARKAKEAIQAAHRGRTFSSTRKWALWWG